jgi:hypothetical protein
MTEYHLKSATGRTVSTFEDVVLAKLAVQGRRAAGINARLFKVVKTEVEVDVEDAGPTPLEKWIEGN